MAQAPVAGPWQIVKRRTDLRKLQAAGLIDEPPEHCRPKGKQWGANGYCYVETVEGGLCSHPHRFRGYEFRVKYYDGCFFPFVETRSFDLP